MQDSIDPAEDPVERHVEDPVEDPAEDPMEEPVEDPVERRVEEWVTLAEASRVASVSISALRSWYRSGDLESRVLDGPHGPQRLVPLDAVLARAERSPRLRRKVERELTMEAQLALLQARVDALEAEVARLRRFVDLDGLDVDGFEGLDVVDLGGPDGAWD